MHCGFGVFIEILILLNMTFILVHTPCTDAVLLKFSIQFGILFVEILKNKMGSGYIYS